MKKVILMATALVFSLTSFAQTWVNDPGHSKLNFIATHLLISEVEGGFKTFNAKVTSAKEDFTDAVIELTADVNSLDTGNERRDQDLKSEKFFDVAKYPTLTFKSTSLKQVDGKKYKLAGNLTMHGVTKPVEWDVIYNGTIAHPMSKKPVAGFKVTGTVKRSDFGIGTIPVAIVSDEINILANAELNKN